MKRIFATCALGFLMSVGMVSSANAATAVKCLAEFHSVNWPYNGTHKYTPNNTNFKFVCPGVSGNKTIPELYGLGWSLVGLPWSEQIFGGYNSYAIWITKP